MMSLTAFKFYYWLMFIWALAGILVIAVAVIRELGIQVKTLKKKKAKSGHEELKTISGG